MTEHVNNYLFKHLTLAARLSALVLSLVTFIHAQKLAVLTPEKTDASSTFAEKLESELSNKIQILDDSLSQSAYSSLSPATPFNLKAGESKNIGAAIGCDFFLLLKSATQRRSAYQRPEYYESYAVIYLVSSRTGRLVSWRLATFEGAKPVESQELLSKSISSLVLEIIEQVRWATKKEITESPKPEMEEMPDENSPLAKNLRSPVPYRRIKPEYTTQAALYSVTATVEIEVDLDAGGAIQRTEIVRWAGYGLDESVEKAVRTMNWRPAIRDGKPLPMRFLLRYNFKKPDKD